MTGTMCFQGRFQKKAARLGGPPADCSVHDLNDPMRSRIDQYGAIVDHRIAVMGRTVFAGNLIIGDATARELGADAHFALVAIGRMPPFHDIAVETRSRVVGNTASGGARSRADRGS